VWIEGDLVAFCGGTSRALRQAEHVISGMQGGDVMVHPNWRGILTRKGPFYFASSRLYSSTLGAVGQRPFQLGFGFPSQMHMRLLGKIGLALDGGQMKRLLWTHLPAPPKKLWSWRWSEILPSSQGFDAAIQSAWAAMQRDTGNVLMGERGVDYIRWRFVDMPQGAHTKYRFHTIRRPWQTEPSGIAVLDLSVKPAHWLDWIGSSALMALAVQHALQHAKQHGTPELQAWASSAVCEVLQNTAVADQSTCAWIGIPAASDVKPDDLPALNWWLMGGDTDFL
jgi:GNAT superfamily N-acetyltransferase